MSRGPLVLTLATAAFALLLVPVMAVQALAVFGLLLLVLSRGYSWVLARAVTIHRPNGLIRTHRLAPCVVELRVENRSLLPLHYLLLEDLPGELGNSGNTAVALSLRPRETKSFQHRVTGYRRGEYRVGPARLTGSDPFGLFPWKTAEQGGGTVIVYPSVFQIRLPAARGLPGGPIRLRDPLLEDITQYRSLRDYLPGDEPRRINWKASARTGTLLTKDFDPSASGAAIILLNLLGEDYPLDRRQTLQERALEAAASLAWYGNQEGRGVGLFLVDAEGSSWYAPASGVPHIVSLLEALARARTFAAPGTGGRKGQIPRTFGGSVLASRPHLPPATRLHYVGPALDEEGRLALASRLPASGSLELFLVSRGRPSPGGLGLRRVQVYEISDYGDQLFHPR